MMPRLLLLLLVALPGACGFFSISMGLGNTRRSARRLQKQMKREDRRVMRQGGRVVSTPYESSSSVFPAPWAAATTAEDSTVAAAVAAAAAASAAESVVVVDASKEASHVYDVSVVAPNTAVFKFLNGSSLTANTTHLHQKHDMEAWLATRRCLQVTASEFAAVLGKSPFTKRADLLATKLGTKPAFRGNAATAWGLRVEPLAVKQYAEATGNTVYETGLWTHPTDHRIGASPDGLVFDPNFFPAGGGPSSRDEEADKAAAGKAAGRAAGSVAAAATENAGAEEEGDGSSSSSDDNGGGSGAWPQGILEVKCFFGRRHKKELAQWTNCPNRFFDQIQGQLEVCDREWCDLMLWIPKNSRKRNYCIIRVQRNRDYFGSTLQPELDAFCNELEAARVEMS